MALMALRNKLREARKANELSAYDLAILSNIPPGVIYQIERGLRRPRAFERRLLSEALQKPQADIFPENLEDQGAIFDSANGERISRRG